ncbi:Reverse transcriptase [Phytophthora palmivora]|uniref:Reverse transcriptase n=1 Tax=Phytophthora palmivora TaxID=4796 RepID=A0A2P4XTI7_9STRA|nr:Reverse transcriptase [Phytophthora palmivora]
MDHETGTIPYDAICEVLWYCSLDMASGFWVMTMTDRARAISAFITPFGLFEWNRMPFGLKNAPQIYQRLIDNALYGFTRIPPPGSDPRSTDVFEVGETDDTGKPSVIGRRSDIDDILIPGDSWDQLCDRGGALVEACDKWNLSISVVKGFWGMSKVEYLGHRVSKDGLEANPKDLEALTDLAFPGSLRSMQSFLGSLNYYSRFIEDYAIYAAVLYESREIDFAAMSKMMCGPR